MRATISKVTSAAIALATGLVAAAGCSTASETGACVSRDGANSYCFEDTEDYACSGIFSSGSSCRAVGYPYYCTSEDMKASGSPDVYAVSRYLDNSACNPGGGSGGGGADGGSASGQALVQFYADPAKFSREAGYVITGIEAEGRTFSPRSSRGTCEERIVLKGAVLPGSPSPRVKFHLLARNYNSLDTAFGAEYTAEEGWAVFYINDFKPGCNTLEVTGSSNNITLQLSQVAR